MTRSDKLSSALGLLEFKLNKEFSALVEIMQNKIENEKKLTDLISYKNSYSLKAKDNQTITNIQLNHKLMNKLQHAIDIQHDVVKKLENAMNEKIQLLKNDQAQTKALEILVGRYRRQEAIAKNRNDQKELDNQIIANLKLE